jgi:hypothetical protein
MTSFALRIESDYTLQHRMTGAYAVLHGGEMNIPVSNALLVSHENDRLHRWVILTDQITAICLKPRSEFPDLPSILQDMDNATWLVLRYDKPDVFLTLSKGHVTGQHSASPPPLELADVAGILDDLSDSRAPEGVRVLPVWALAGITGPREMDH